ncbi:hypothetical protein STRCI_002556 [Streptomyces cinnabarinus]|uniref:Uncharacterized protein n=1 Tax=Streptomyces cinnabarinus TaxID=67287 RepID=A0ABY7KA44_9ACTN|nr:hypothetical protein [Streptomyces cinnabarinus]WAZ21389.1 hypothetical protein STRCI_002556 [Streptomyces cinnabarinus]
MRTSELDGKGNSVMGESDVGRGEVRTGNVSGQVVVGSGNIVIRSESGITAPTPATEQEIAQLRAEFARVRTLVPIGEPNSDRAQELLNELEESITGDIDLNIMDYVRGWFARRLPALAAAVTDLVLHPVTTSLVAASGSDRANEFWRRFGSSPSSGQSLR